MKIYLGADHAGYELKEEIKRFLTRRKYDVEDCGTDSSDPVNWADFGARAAKRVSENPDDSMGIIICGTGIGMSMTSNKHANVRAALCYDEYTAEMSRRHNNANVLNIGARVLTKEEAIRIVEIWLNTPFDGGRHQKRLEFLHDIVERQNFK